MQLSSVVISGPGKVRDENQDNFYLDGIYRSEPSETSVQCIQNSAYGTALYAVADGMGGEEHGELASLIAVSSMDNIDRSLGNEGLNRYLLARNEDICRFITGNSGIRSGSTFVGLCIRDGYVDMINIGDSRAYLLREGCLSQISKDHTPVRQMVELGIVSPEAAQRHPDRHKLTQHLGIFPDELIIEPYMVSGNALCGDLFLLCSDGLYDMVDDAHIQNILLDAGNLRDKASELFAAAMEAGGRDNITILLVSIGA